MRRRASAVIVCGGAELMVSEATHSNSGRHDGPSYLTLPGGGVGESRPGVHDEPCECPEVVALEWVPIPVVCSLAETPSQLAEFLLDLRHG
ncbi:hypothetical protein [Kineococcus sp. NUM-3379]